MRGEVAVEVLLDVLGAARVAACLCEPAPGAGGRRALHPELGAAEVEPGARAAAGRDPLAAPLPHLLVVPAHQPLVSVRPRPANYYYYYYYYYGFIYSRRVKYIIIYK